MKNLIATIFLIGILSVFLIFISETEKTKEVLEVYTPTKIGIDIDNNKRRYYQPRILGSRICN